MNANTEFQPYTIHPILGEMGRYQTKIYTQLAKQHGEAETVRIMKRRLATDLHPDFLCDRDYDCWLRWEMKRNSEKA